MEEPKDMGDKTTIKDEVAIAVKDAMATAHATATAAASTLAMSVDIAYIKDDIKEIKGFQKEALKSFISTSDFTEHLKADADHEIRIRVLEKAMWKWIGVSSVVTASLSLLANHFLSKI